MSVVSAKFFGWLQATPFYEGLHDEAVALLGPGTGRAWLDVGCGPGLVARLAARRGFEAVGIDSDPAMVRSAKARARAEPRCTFEVGGLGTWRGAPRDVVSAASLVILMADACAALEELWRLVVPGGSLLVIETTPSMTTEGSQTIAPSLSRRSRAGLAIWARARRGRAVDRALFDHLDAVSRSRTPLLDGLVEAWIFRKAVA